MEDLATLNSRVGEFLQAGKVSMIRTGDILTGRKDCPVIHYMDALYEMWGSDKIAYSKIAIGLLDKLNKNLPETDLRPTSSLGRGHWMPLLISTPKGRLRTHAASASAREAPTGSKTATATTIPAGTTRLTSTDPTGISPHFPPIQETSFLAATPLPAAPGGAAVAAALATKYSDLRPAWTGKQPSLRVQLEPSAGGHSSQLKIC
jgi:hypothetical protein